MSWPGKRDKVCSLVYRDEFQEFIFKCLVTVKVGQGTTGELSCFGPNWRSNSALASTDPRAVTIFILANRGGPLLEFFQPNFPRSWQFRPGSRQAGQLAFSYKRKEILPKKRGISRDPGKATTPPFPLLCIYLLITCLWEQTQCLSCIKTRWNVNSSWYKCIFPFFSVGKKRTLSVGWKSKWRRWKCNMITY